MANNGMPIELYTDGSCLKNPGVGGYSYVIRYWVDNSEGIPEPTVIDGNKGYRLTTNNRMEIMGILAGVDKVIDMINNLELKDVHQINAYSDSEYVCNAINQNWIYKWANNNWMTSGFKGDPKPVKNKDLWEKIIEMQNKIKNLNIVFTISHVDGHSGHEFNERADKLAVAASNGTTYDVDEEYEKTTNIKNY